MTESNPDDIARRIVADFVERSLTDDRSLSLILGFRPDALQQELATRQATTIQPGLEHLVRTYVASLQPVIEEAKRRERLYRQLSDLVWSTTDPDEIERLERIVAELLPDDSADSQVG